MQIVLELTVEAYQNMRSNGVAHQGWEEDTFTINLEDYIRTLAHTHPLSLRVKSQVPIYTSEMKIGSVPPKHAVKIDIQLWGNWENYDQVYFAWECKLVVDKRVDPNREYLINEYIKNGIFRFLDEKYASEVNDAGMLGYVLAGDVANIVNAINRSMQRSRRKRQLTSLDHLQPASPINKFTDVYRSRHNRVSTNRAIQLHHLFLTFDFK